jgi:PAS domain S-box-containing protein
LTEVIDYFLYGAFLATENSLFSENVLMTTNLGYNSPITLLSETDSLGKITFVNDAFCRISKYTRDELLGQPHNIVRHPDMPRELFDRLWSTILRGDIFKAVMKNRAQDGSHYWVNATIMAIHDQDKHFGKCIGVRHLIPDEDTARKLFDIQAAKLGIRR